MSIIKCKMCGGELNIVPNSTVCECEYCGSKQTVPNTDDEKRLRLYERANKLRFENEFDKAEGVYESIISEFQMEAEAYWGILLCKYGIEYVDDPKTGKKIPTCHRTSFDSIMEDDNFELVMENADVVARGIYREEAKKIESLRKNIIEVSSKEEPYDIFICYKETADDGQRTLDSVIAQDVYNALIEKGYKVFFSRITLEDKLGEEYEPYIFAALNSAKVMLVFGTSYEYFNAVWVKNEWSRFLQLIESGQKKTLIPCYKDIDAYDIPKEFAKLQAQDMGKVGAVQDLLRGIEKIIPISKQDNIKDIERKRETLIIKDSNSNTDALLKRIVLFLEDEEWNSAAEYTEKVLDMDPENGYAYFYKMLAELNIKEESQLNDYYEPIENNKLFKKAMRFADDDLQNKLNGYNDAIIQRIKEETTKKKKAEKDRIYKSLVAQLNNSFTEAEYKRTFDALKKLNGYKDSDELAQKCLALAEKAKIEEIYVQACDLMTSDDKQKITKAIDIFGSISSYKDSYEKINQCNSLINTIELKEEEKRQKEEKEKQEKIEKDLLIKKRRKILAIVLSVLSLFTIALLVLIFVVIPKNKEKKQYNEAMNQKSIGNYNDAINILQELDAEKYSEEIIDCKYGQANNYLETKEYDKAKDSFEEISEYKDSSDKINECVYLKAVDLENNKKNKEALELYSEILSYKDSSDRKLQCEKQMFLDRIDAGYIANRAAESFSFSDEKDSVYGSNEVAYKYIKVEGFEADSNETISLFITCIDGGEIIKVGKHDFSYGDNYFKIEESIEGIDSEMYIFSSVDEYNSDDFKNALVHEKIEYSGDETHSNNVVTEIPEGVEIYAGFYNRYEYQNGTEFDTTHPDFLTQYDAKSSDIWETPIVIVNGLNDNTVLKLYVVVEMSHSEYGTSYCNEGEFEFSKDKNYYHHTFLTMYWGSVYHCDGKLYVFNDYDAYLDHDFDKAIASGSIKYTGD